jgi:HPt (histidine-containing phosphotransfer) domain-containing protein
VGQRPLIRDIMREAMSTAAILNREDTTNSAPSAPLDCGRLLAVCGSEGVVIRRVLEAFIDSTRSDLAGMDSALVARDVRVLAELAHRVRGAAASIGAEPMREEAEHMETLGRSGNLLEAGDSLPRLRAEFERLHGYVDRIAVVGLSDILSKGGGE